MDDIAAIIATPPSNPALAAVFFSTLQDNTYDKDNKNLTIEIQEGHIFLDAIFHIYNSLKSIKITYNNKNLSILDSDVQTIGRFHHINAPSLITHKLSAAQTILIKINDFTTHKIDMIQPTLALHHELTTLNYTANHFLSALTKANRTRKNSFWHTLAHALASLPHHNN